MIAAGIDIGTAAVKLAFSNGNEMLWHKALPSSCRNLENCERLLKEGLDALQVKETELAGIASTGYGKALFKRAALQVNEISANALGAFLLSGGKARAIINIGGQDVKVLSLTDGGKVSDFKMNDKCAAGTGRFFEMAERILETPLQDFGALGLASENPIELNSSCAVFAETEIVTLVAEGRDKTDIIAGLNMSIAKRIAFLSAGMELKDSIFLDGGPARNADLLERLRQVFSREIKVLPQPQFTVAFGAAAPLLR